jgi:hypothetical protein
VKDDLVTLAAVLELYGERPFKFGPEQVGYGPAPEGSAIRCASCLSYFKRAIDGHAVCEIFRSEETDQEGVRPDYRCQFWTSDGDVYPLTEESDDTEDTR